jgi:chaperone modulatory protein CbpM
MTRPELRIEVVLGPAWDDLESFCRAAAVRPEWLQARIDAGLLAAERLDAVLLRRVRRLQDLERDFDAAPELAALVADLEDEILRLRRRLARHGLA